MSKTYNSKHKFYKESGIVEYPNGYDKKILYDNDNETFEQGKEYDYNITHTTSSDNINTNTIYKCTRHPNKKNRKAALTREFHSLGLSNPINWKYRFGDAYDKSNRNRLSRSELAHRRRHRFNEETRKLINEAYENNQ